MTSFDDLPDDAVVNVLSRLSVKQILHTRIVCKLWNRLTTLPEFARVQIENSTPVDLFLRHEFTTDRNLHRLSYVDWADSESGGETKIRSTVLKTKYICGGCDGLFIGKELGFDTRDDHYILNPVTREQREVPGVGLDFVLGLYFHQPTKGYRLLCLSSQGKGIDHRFYTRRATSAMPQTEVGTFAHHVPVFTVADSMTVEDRIYSLLCCSLDTGPCCDRLICVFQTNTEKLEFMPYPVKCRSHDDGLGCGTHRLINMAGKLGMAHEPMGRDGGQANIWVLEDPTIGLWVRKFFIPQYTIMYRLNIARVMSFKDGEFVVGNNRSLSLYRAGGAAATSQVSTLERIAQFRGYWLFMATLNCKLSLLSPREI